MDQLTHAIAGYIHPLSVYLLPVVFAITLHEAAHGYVARHFGDPTAALAGRISLNPLRHIDPVGTILVPMIVLFASNFAFGRGLMFGWAKPVPVAFGNLRNPKRDMMWVALAGPASNLLMAFCWGLFGHLQVSLGSEDTLLREMARAGIGVNIGLMLINLIPIPPLDGGRVAVSLLPPAMAWQYAKLERFGIPILLVLIYTGVVSSILFPFFGFFDRLISTTFAFN